MACMCVRGVLVQVICVCIQLPHMCTCMYLSVCIYMQVCAQTDTHMCVHTGMHTVDFTMYNCERKKLRTFINLLSREIERYMKDRKFWQKRVYFSS